MSFSCLKHKNNVFSQNGEDGIIKYIFDKMDIKNGCFVEFGAWDGKHLSNTYNLYLNKWEGIYIESEKDKYIHLVNNFKNDPKITCIHSMVGYDEKDNLDAIIDNSNYADKEFDIISIDVDGLDYNILKKINKYLPKVICIEINAGHSPIYDKEIPISISHNNIGQSIKIISDYAATKDYFPLCYTGNLFLIQNKYKDLFETDIKDLQQIYIEFLQYLEPEGLEHLRKTFVIKKIYNGFVFKNNILENFLNET